MLYEINRNNCRIGSFWTRITEISFDIDLIKGIIIFENSPGIWKFFFCICENVSLRDPLPGTITFILLLHWMNYNLYFQGPGLNQLSHFHCRVVNGLDSCTLNGSIFSSNAHKICDGSVQSRGGHSNRVKKNVQLDLTQHQRVCQATCTLRSLLPDTGSTYMTSLTKHDPILFTRVYESGFEANDQLHLVLVECILLRSKLALAIESNLGRNLRSQLISEIRLVSSAHVHYW